MKIKDLITRFCAGLFCMATIMGMMYFFFRLGQCSWEICEWSENARTALAIFSGLAGLTCFLLAFFYKEINS